MKIIFTVEDNGRGIDEIELNRLRIELEQETVIMHISGLINKFN